jgi:hypothetical protein
MTDGSRTLKSKRWLWLSADDTLTMVRWSEGAG